MELPRRHSLADSFTLLDESWIMLKEMVNHIQIAVFVQVQQFETIKLDTHRAAK